MEKEIAVGDVVFRDDLYPRLETSPTTVQKYAETLDVLPPAEVNQKNELIDGWHRWTAHKKTGLETINVIVTKTRSDEHLLELAIERNAKFGLQLSQTDKRDLARRIYKATALEEQGEKKKTLARILSVTEKTVSNWLSRIDKDNKEKREVAIVNLWLACKTQQEIAEAVIGGTTKAEKAAAQRTVARVLDEMESFRFCLKLGQCELEKHDGETDKEYDARRILAIEKENIANASHTSDFEPPLYNIWKQQTKTDGSSHFGNSEVRWLDNLLYLYTKPFDVVVDPFGGGGSTIDICKKRLRRYLVSDRKPIVERELDIRQHDIVTDGVLKPPQWKDVKLVYLDPPYWKQAEGRYSDDPTDLANMPLDEFTSALAKIVEDYDKKINDAYIALIISPTQYAAPDREFTDHIGDMLREVALPVDMRFSAPYESQQCSAQMVEWAKENRKTLVLTREIVVWKVA